MEYQLSTSFGWGKGGKVTTAGWQLTLCDSIWHVISCSGVTLWWLLYPSLLFLLFRYVRVFAIANPSVCRLSFVVCLSSVLNRIHPHLFHHACGSNTIPSGGLQHRRRNSAAGRSKKITTWAERHFGIAGMALSNASAISLQTSSVNVTECVFM